MFSLKFVRYAMTMWLPLYLLEHLGYSKLQAGIFSTVFDIGGIIGAPVFGLLLDRYYADRPLLGVILTMALGSLVTLLFIITSSWGMVINLSCLLVAGAANCGPDAILSGMIIILSKSYQNLIKLISNSYHNIIKILSKSYQNLIRERELQTGRDWGRGQGRGGDKLRERGG